MQNGEKSLDIQTTYKRYSFQYRSIVNIDNADMTRIYGIIF